MKHELVHVEIFQGEQIRDEQALFEQLHNER